MLIGLRNTCTLKSWKMMRWGGGGRKTQSSPVCGNRSKKYCWIFCETWTSGWQRCRRGSSRKDWQQAKGRSPGGLSVSRTYVSQLRAKCSLLVRKDRAVEDLAWGFLLTWPRTRFQTGKPWPGFPALMHTTSLSKIHTWEELENKHWKQTYIFLWLGLRAKKIKRGPFDIWPHA